MDTRIVRQEEKPTPALLSEFDESYDQMAAQLSRQEEKPTPARFSHRGCRPGAVGSLHVLLQTGWGLEGNLV